MLLRYIGGVLLVLLISALFGLLFGFLFSGFSIFYWSRLYNIVIYSLILGALCWTGGEIITRLVSRRFPWEVQPGKTFLISIVASVIYTFVSVTAFNIVYFRFVTSRDLSSGELIQGAITNSIIAVIITVIIMLIISVLKFIKNFKEVQLAREREQREVVSAQYAALKNHINPHFLFNSLSVLTSLVETDTQASIKFIRKLSDLYRYVLEMQNKETIALTEELALIEGYLYMQKFRYGDALKVTINIESRNGHIVPLSIQMLVENAIKHNIVSTQKPLEIIISQQNEEITVSNNYQPKEIIEESNKSGLENIRQRYSFLKNDLRVEWGVTENKFIVRLPILNYK